MKFFLYLTASAATATAFVGPATKMGRRMSTKVNLEDRIADLVDQEAYRQSHKSEFEKEWMEKNRGAVLQSVGAKVAVLEEPELDFRQQIRDKKLAKKNPQEYCADRCIATGNCDVFEDFFEFSPEEVMHFCTDCVLADDDEPCEVPGAFFDTLDTPRP